LTSVCWEERRRFWGVDEFRVITERQNLSKKGHRLLI